ANAEERPFTRDQRRWVYASAKKENNYFGFGTDNDVEHTAGYPAVCSTSLSVPNPK
ncbi:FMN-binding glutamate synthase family protein, partial [Mycobacterium sp. ITM-2017-0098]